MQTKADPFDELLRVYPGEELVQSLLVDINGALHEAIAQFESGKNEGAAVQVGKAHDKMTDLLTLWAKMKQNA